ncbi:hypothetical protein, partial [Streptomyces cacaoi]|uniref:hypothetical protein n=1 Tax=Streptomyces cacaoi TaxID=1898 RepID=UPI001BB2907D
MPVHPPQGRNHPGAQHSAGHEPPPTDGPEAPRPGPVALPRRPTAVRTPGTPAPAGRKPIAVRDGPAPRDPGMTMFRMPIFTWNVLLTGVLVLLAFPVL